MSGIFGIIDRDGRAIDPVQTARMMQALAHRGPDGTSIEQGEGFALGHCLLDTAGGGPAMGCLLVEGDFVITADCRIDNRDELAALLDLPPQASDTAMLLRAYHLWGDRFPARILGDFAVAIWNSKERVLFIARDHFGVKPFYYFNDPRYFIFASEPEAMFRSGLAARLLADERIADFLAGTAPGVEQTSYLGLMRLPPAHYGTCDAGGFRCAPFYTLSRPAILKRADAPGEFRRLLAQAVAARLRGGPAGLMLSGGLDSSSIAALAVPARGQTAGPIASFSLVFDETPELNERPFIEAVLAGGGLRPSFIASNQLAHFAALDQILDEQQEPFLAPNLACARQIYHHARSAGIRVLLDGHGGDEVAPVGGGRLFELAARGKWITLWRALGGSLLQDNERKPQVFWTILKRYSLLRRLVRLGQMARRRRGRGHARPAPARAIMNPDFIARLDAAAAAGTRTAAAMPPGRPARVSEQSIQHQLLTMPLQASAFEILDRTAAPAGIEARYPFWDRRLVEFCLSLAPEEKLDNGWGRLILRRAMEGLLPPMVQWRRRKFDFTRHLATSIVRDHAALVRTVLADPDGLLGTYVDLAAAGRMMDRLSAAGERPDGFEVQMIFRIMILAFWLKHQHSPAAVPAPA